MSESGLIGGMVKKVRGLFGTLLNALAGPTAGEPHLHKQRGYSLLESNPRAAIEEFSLALSKNQADAETLLARGNAYRSLKEYDPALQDYGMVVVLGRPELKVEALLARGQLYLDQGNVEKAVEDFNDAVEREPHNAQALTARNLALQRQGGAPAGNG